MPAQRIALLLIGIFGAVVLYFIVVGGHGSSAPPVPSDWVTINAGGAFTFNAPATLKAVPTRGIDSFVGRYASRTLDVSFDYGPYSDPMEREGFVGRSVTVNGRYARLIRRDNVVAIHVPNVTFATFKEKTRLTMVVTLTGIDADSKVAEAMLMSIRFP